MSRQLRRAFIDIINGYSPLKFGAETVYLRHLTHRDHLDIEELQAEYFDEAVRAGVPDAKTREDMLRKDGLWSDKKERAILDQKAYVSGMIAGRKNIHLPSVLAKVNEQIKVEEKKLADMESEKAVLMDFTAESYASKKTNDYFLFKSLYKDTECTIPLYSATEFDDLTEKEVSEIVSAYNVASEICSEKTIKLLAIQDFYQSYYYLCEDDFCAFFGRPICEFTFNQIKLANYSRYFKSILEGVDLKTLDEKIANDPDALIAYLDVRKKGQEVIQKAAGNGGMTTLVGATAEDLKALSPDGQVSRLPQKPMNMNEMIKMQRK